MFLMQCHKVAFFRPWYDWETLLVLTQIQTIQQQIPGQNLLIHRLSVYCRWCTVVQVARSFGIRWTSFLLLQIPHLSWNHCSHFGSIVAWTCSWSGFWYAPLQYLGSAAYLLLKTHYTFYNLSRDYHTIINADAVSSIQHVSICQKFTLVDELCSPLWPIIAKNTFCQWQTGRSQWTFEKDSWDEQSIFYSYLWRSVLKLPW